MQIKHLLVYRVDHRSFGQKKGFTLLEILVAVAIMTFALIAVFRLYTQTITMNYMLSFNTMAPFLSQKKMAELIVLQGEELEDSSGDFGEAFPGYIWQVKIEDVVLETFETNDLKKIDLRISLVNDPQEFYLRRYRYLRD